MAAFWFLGWLWFMWGLAGAAGRCSGVLELRGEYEVSLHREIPGVADDHGGDHPRQEILDAEQVGEEILARRVQPQAPRRDESVAPGLARRRDLGGLVGEAAAQREVGDRTGEGADRRGCDRAEAGDLDAEDHH